MGVNGRIHAIGGNIRLPQPLGTGTNEAFTPGPLAFTSQVAGAFTGTAFARQPAVEVRDDQGDRVTTDNTTQVTLAITGGTGTAGAVLSGTTTVTVVNGWATFSGLSIDSAGSGYTLAATAPGVSSTISSLFNVFGPANRVYWTDNGTGADKVQRADSDGSNVQARISHLG